MTAHARGNVVDDLTAYANRFGARSFLPIERERFRAETEFGELQSTKSDRRGRCFAQLAAEHSASSRVGGSNSVVRIAVELVAHGTVTLATRVLTKNPRPVRGTAAAISAMAAVLTRMPTSGSKNIRVRCSPTTSDVLRSPPQTASPPIADPLRQRPPSQLLR